ncbi:hypothetical protein FRC02_000160 [Tulasnella sp. 418]|nr:hypothetical protein FRC02_000160 [Tulasnella sp. 418]
MKTPATCTNIALHNLFPGQIDLVISGPNYGRNTSSAFSLSSGTIGAALSACLSLTRSIALSFGTFHHPSPAEYIPPAIELSVSIIEKLWNGWGKDPNGIRNGEVDLYNVNLPMVAQLLEKPGLEVAWTQIWRNNYGSLFKEKKFDNHAEDIGKAGPDAPPPSLTSESNTPPVHSDDNGLVFQFSPQIQQLVNPDITTLPYGTDAWAIHQSKASVTPLRSAFAEPGLESFCLITENLEGHQLATGRIFAL